MHDTLEPRHREEVAEAVRAAHADRRSLLPQGARTKSWRDDDPSFSKDAAVLSMLGLNRPIDHVAGDLTVTVPAGTTLRALNDVLAREGQWLPLDPSAADRATIGGIIATNDSGPRRHRHGAPRDLIIGIDMVLADGRPAKAGGRVVKNVAGYDLARLMCGSYGTLAVITGATFKLAPLPAASCTVVAQTATARHLGQLARGLAAAPLTPSAIELDAPPYRLLIRFETTLRAAEQQAAAARDLCRRHDASPQTLTGSGEAQLWAEATSPVWCGTGALVKVAVLPTMVTHVLEQLDREAADHRLSYRAGGRVTLGVIYLRITGAADIVGPLLQRLRRDASERGGSVVLLEGDATLRRAFDPWGRMGGAFRVMQAIKSRFDPDGILPPLMGTM